MSPSSASMSERIELLDILRSAAVTVMVVYHFIVDLRLFGFAAADIESTAVMTVVRVSFRFLFILLAGVTISMGKRPARHGVRLLICAAAVTVATVLVAQPVWFGILHLFAVCALLYAVARKLLRGRGDSKTLRFLSGPAGAIACIALFVLTDALITGLRVQTPWLFPLGLRTEAFRSADYYPLLPWAFLFLLGAWAGPKLAAGDYGWKKLRFPKWSTWPGKNSLLVYIIHQPLLYGGVWLASVLL